MSSYPKCLEDISIPDSCVLLCTTAAPGKFAVLVTLAILMSLQKGKKKSCQIEYKLLYKMYFRIISLTLQCLLSEENNSNQKEKNGEVDRLKKVF